MAFQKLGQHPDQLSTKGWKIGQTFKGKSQHLNPIPLKKTRKNCLNLPSLFDFQMCVPSVCCYFLFSSYIFVCLALSLTASRTLRCSSFKVFACFSASAIAWVINISDIITLGNCHQYHIYMNIHNIYNLHLNVHFSIWHFSTSLKFLHQRQREIWGMYIYMLFNIHNCLQQFLSQGLLLVLRGVAHVQLDLCRHPLLATRRHHHLCHDHHDDHCRHNLCLEHHEGHRCHNLCLDRYDDHRRLTWVASKSNFWFCVTRCFDSAVTISSRRLFTFGFAIFETFLSW